MPDGMPFMKQKGAPLSNIDATALTRIDLLALLEVLHDENNEVAVALFDKGLVSVKTRDHLRRDWFGRRQIEGNWLPQLAFGEVDPETNSPVLETGFWVNWYGDVESIVRVAAIRAIERMLGLKPLDYPQLVPLVGDAVGTAYDNPEPDGPMNVSLEVWWCCPQPRFEATVEASLENLQASTGGTVRVEFFTPAPENGILGSGYRGLDPKPFTAPDVNPPPTSIAEVFQLVGTGGPAPKDNGGQIAVPTNLQNPLLRESWIVGQDEVLSYADLGWFKLEGSSFQIFDPFTRFRGVGDPATIDVTTKFGGVA